MIATREAAQLFNLLLKLQMPNGQQASIQAQSSQPIAPGEILNLTAVGGQNFTFNLSGAQAAPALTRFDPAQFPPGSQIQARVLQVEPQAQGNFRITLTLNSGAQAGQHFVVESPKALAVNSLVSAQVNGRFELSLIPARHSFEQLAVRQELGSQFVRQGSPAQVLQQLMQLAQPGGGSSSPLSGLPADSQKLVQQLLAGLPELGSKLSGSQIAELIKNSGIQMESRLHGEQTAQQDLKASLLRLIGQILPQQAHANPLTAGTRQQSFHRPCPSCCVSWAARLLRSANRRCAFRSPAAFWKNSTTPTTWVHCCGWRLPPSPACKPISCPAWHKPTPHRTAPR